MDTTWTELAAAYLFISAIALGLLMIFFAVTFLPGLMRTTGEQIGARSSPWESTQAPAQPLAHDLDKPVPARQARHQVLVRNFGNTA